MPVDVEKKRAYHKKYNRAHYLANKPMYIEKSARRIRDLAAWFSRLKSKLKCSRCPEADARCLDFHHLGDKEDSVADMVRRGLSQKRILAEIAKCIVLCANCHRKEHR